MTKRGEKSSIAVTASKKKKGTWKYEKSSTKNDKRRQEKTEETEGETAKKATNYAKTTSFNPIYHLH